MTGEELIAWGLVLAILFGAGWLLSKAVRWLRSRRRRLEPPARVRWVERPAASSTGARLATANAMASAADQPAPTHVQLGPPRPIKLDANTPFGTPRYRRGAPLVIPDRADPLWKEKGWQRQGNTYYGRYRVNGRSWRGMIQEPYPGGYKAYIWNPPLRELEERNHPHRPCFMHPHDGRYEVHFASTPTSLDHVITNIEQILREATSARH